MTEVNVKSRYHWNSKTISKFQRLLLQWYSDNQRALPWRNNPTPYRVWISEIMLQQTQVKTVIPYYNRFLKRFPDIQALAQSSEKKILNFWSGLGYYSRARNLHKAAKQIMRTHGTFPIEYEAILALPGIGRYTAGAICSIALNQPRPVVDGNIRRALIRLNGIRKLPSESYFWNLMTDLLPGRNPSGFNQAMMELGALICVPSQPLCRQCPVKKFCKARQSGIQNEIPKVSNKRITKQLTIVILLLEKNGRILIARSNKPQFIPGEWLLPYRSIPRLESAEKSASTLCRNMLGRDIPLVQFAQIRHSITEHRIVAYGFRAKEDFRITELKKTGDYQWVPCNSYRETLTSSLFHKIVQRYRNSLLL